MRRKLLALAVAVVVPVTALQAMTVETFLQKADALKARGMGALFSSDIRLLKNEVTGSVQRLRSERQAALKAGRRPAYCPPEGQRRSGLNSDELLSHFRSIPPAQRQRMEVREGLQSLLARKYPCPA